MKEMWMRRTVLIFVPHFLPGYRGGGPIRSVANLVRSLGKVYDFRIVTSDRDLGMHDSYANVEIGRWVQVEAAQVMYLSPEMQRLKIISTIMKETAHDVVYLNSFLHPRFSLLPLIASKLAKSRRPVVLAPRGEFSRVALRIKRLKKSTFICASRLIRLHAGIRWQASSALEAADIQRAIGGQAKDICIASDLPHFEYNIPSKPIRHAGDPLRVLFASRICKMKNLDFALRVLAEIKVPIELTIVGPIDDPDYWDHCGSLIRSLPDNVRVQFDGPLHPDALQPLMAVSDLLFLPTQGENFGHVIIEALAAGTPVLISDQTPWQDLEEKGVGWCIPLSEKHVYISAILKLFAMKKIKNSEMRSKCLAYAGQFMKENNIIEENRKIFHFL
ncbi:MAG: hypothetical protein CFE36_14350 [Sphingomonadaceae bacterium PASS1]|nr:MAG: hypothetical protein CFE36_14350 [Sphingomonadaceae bacterium PASS1]